MDPVPAESAVLQTRPPTCRRVSWCSCLPPSTARSACASAPFPPRHRSACSAWWTQTTAPQIDPSAVDIELLDWDISCGRFRFKYMQIMYNCIYWWPSSTVGPYALRSTHGDWKDIPLRLICESLDRLDYIHFIIWQQRRDTVWQMLLALTRRIDFSQEKWGMYLKIYLI